MKEGPLSAHPSPFVFSGLRLEIASLVVIISLLVQVALMAAFKDARALIAILGSSVGAAACEACFSSPVLSLTGKSQKFADGTAVIHGLLAGFLLPSSINPFLAALASFCGLFVSRNFFNGRGNAWVNASVLSVIIAFVSAPTCFEGAAAFLSAGSGFGGNVSSALNRTVFRSLGVSIPESCVQLFFNPQAPVPALKFGVVTVFSSVVLIALDIIDWIAPAAFVAVFSSAIFFFSGIAGSPLSASASGGGNILFALFSSGAFFAAVYLLSDFPSLPRTRTGRLLFGAVAGVVTFFACGRGATLAIGAVFTVFAANLASLAVCCLEDRVLRRLALRMSNEHE